MVIVVKAFLQLLGCAFIIELAHNACWFVHLLGIACVKKFGDDSDENIVENLKDICAVPKTEAGLVWDGICFAALLLQRRLFSSFYFQHLVTEIKAQTTLASRGADLIFELMQKELLEQQVAEKEVLNKIKEKMEQIKATQRKLSQPDLNGHYAANTLDQFSNASSPLPLELSTALTMPTTVGEGISPRSGTILSATPVAPTPSSGNMTMSLDGYMEPARVSITIPFLSGQQPITSPSDDSFPVFSPPPYHSIRHRLMGQRTASQTIEGDIGPPWLKDHFREQIEKHRNSEPPVSPSISHHASIRSGDYYMFADYDNGGESSLLPIGARSSSEDDPVGMTFSELISTAMKTDIENATEEARLARMSEFEYGIASSRKSSFRRRGIQRTFSGRSALSARSAYSQFSRTSRSTSRSVRISDPQKIYSFPTIPDANHSFDHPPPRMPPPVPPVLPIGSTRCDGEDSIIHDYSQIEHRESQGIAPLLRKALHYFNFGSELVKSTIISLTAHLNKLSKDHRYVSACLSIEKIRLKETEGFSTIPIGQLTFSESDLASNDDTVTNKKNLKSTELTLQLGENIFKGDKEDKKTDKQRKNLKSTELTLQLGENIFKGDKEDKKTDKQSVDFFELPEDFNPPNEHGSLSRFFIAFWYAILSRSELVSYIMVFVNMIKSASILSLPLPFMVFLWGSLSVPRPPRAFWICVIAYTEAIVMIKFLFQFNFFPWHKEAPLNNPFWAPRIIGIEKKNRYAVYDLALLLVIFFHRFMLKCFGLWTTIDGSETGSDYSGSLADDEVEILTPMSQSNMPKNYHSSSDISSYVDSKVEGEMCIKDGFLLPAGGSLDMSEMSQLRDSTSASDNDSSTIVTHNKDSSLLSTAGNSVLSLIRPVGGIYKRPEEKQSISMDSVTGSIPVSDVYYTHPYLGNHITPLLSPKHNALSTSQSLADYSSIDNQQVEYNSKQFSEKLEKFLNDEIANSARRPSMISFKNSDLERTFHPDQPVWNDRSRESVRRCSTISSVTICPTRRSSAITTHFHRRQHSEGSRNSLQESFIAHRNRRLSSYHARSYSVHTGFTTQSSSPLINCHDFNFNQFRNLKWPDIEEVNEKLKLVPGISRDIAKKGKESILKFVFNLLNPKYQLSINVYTYMFMCDFFNFFVLIFGFSAFGTQQGDGGVSAYLEENRVPIPFLVMLILQFALIIIDRALFLRKYILGKLIFQIGAIIGIHIWMFFILPAVTERKFNAKRPPQIFYMIKCLYFLMSAYQIRCGYPTRVMGNFFCKNYGLLNNGSFRVFMNVPFLYELRTLMDWIWTDTSMNLDDWIKMEDIFVRIFQLKCERRLEMEYPQGRGKGRKKLIKYAIGGCSLFVVIGLIWFPLILFALSSTVGLSNPPYDVSLEIEIGSFQPVFRMTAQKQELYLFRENDWIKFNQHYLSDRTAETFLENYDATDVIVAQLSGNSKSVWGISPPAKERMIDELMRNVSMRVKITWKLKRKSNSADVSSECIGYKESATTNSMRQRLVEILNGESQIREIKFPKLLPKFLKVTNKGKATYEKRLAGRSRSREPFEAYVDLTFVLNTENNTRKGSGQDWWKVKEECPYHKRWPKIGLLPKDKTCDYLTFYTFSDKAFPKGLSFISGGGIIGMYTTLVLLVGKWLRTHFSGVSATIMFDDMPNVDRLLQLCLDIYLVRESLELELEEDLFAKLIFLFRSPETLIKWSRMAIEDSQDEEEDPIPIE